MKQSIYNKIRQICTFHGEEGTSGYNLSEEQFKQLFDLFGQREAEVKRELLIKIEAIFKRRWEGKLESTKKGEEVPFNIKYGYKSALKQTFDEIDSLLAGKGEGQ